jgi:hypothetical protein
MDDLTIPELDEADVRALGIRCALESFSKTEEPFTAEELILFAMVIEDYVSDGGTLNVEIADGSLKGAIR